MIINLNSAPRNNEHLRGSIYSGAIYRIAASDESLRLVNAVTQIVVDELGDDYHNVHKRLENAELVAAIRRMKSAVYDSDMIRVECASLMRTLGFDVRYSLFDAARLRVVAHCDRVDSSLLNGPVYGAHRDTWYSNSQSQINWWLPLHDVSEEQTFTFYPEYFSKAIDNSSDKFFYDEWKAEVGFGNSQSSNPGLYPLPRNGRPPEDHALRFSAQKGDVILFSAAHLHATEFNTSGVTRFSIDFRYVSTADQLERIGAPNLDNQSSGSATDDYIRPREALLRSSEGQLTCKRN